jgi:hemerythrin
MLVDPAQLPRLTVRFMNEDHAEEARLLNAAGDAVDAHRAGKTGPEAVTAALEALYVHTRAHFSREEKAMLDASFPAYSFHQAEHVRILGELDEAERGFRETKDGAALAQYLGTLPEILGQHIQSMDGVTARYVSEWGG